jgi:hypothetical protein
VLIDPRIIEGAGFIGVDGLSDRSDEALHEYLRTFIQERQRESEFHPDSWLPIIVRDPAQTAAQIAAAAGDKYSYRDLDDYTDLISRTLKTLPMVSKVTRSGLLEERIYLEYSQERLTAYGVQVGALRHVLSDRNITLPGGTLEVGDKNLTIDPSGEFRDEQEIGDVLVPTSSGRRVYLRDLVSVGRGYEGPARFLNFYSSRDRDGDWRRSRAITLAVQMRSGGQIGEFGRAVDASLIARRNGAAGRSWRSTAPRCRNRSSNPSCSASSVAHSPVRCRPSPARSSRRPAACCFSTKSER